jgi:propionyl-CoA synthetase
MTFPVLTVGTPDSGAFFRVINEHKVNALLTAPTVFRSIRQDDPQAQNIAK